MYQKILVPLDGSGLAECVFEHVKAIATGCNVPEVTFVHIVQPYPATLDDEEVAVLPSEKARKEGAQFIWDEGFKKAQKWGKDYIAGVVKDMKSAGVAAEGTVLQGKNPAEKILDYAKKNGVDLIIMSTHGRSGPARWAFGSVTDRVIRLSAAPVMVIRPAQCTVPA